VARQARHLRLEQVAQRGLRGGCHRVPGEVPNSRSDLLLVPIGSALSSPTSRTARSCARVPSRAAARRIDVPVLFYLREIPVTAAVMSIVTAWMPSVLDHELACSRLSGEEVRYGIRTPSFSYRALAAKEGRERRGPPPPESPTIPLGEPARRTTSSFRKLVSTGEPSRNRSARVSFVTPRPTRHLRRRTGEGERFQS